MSPQSELSNYYGCDCVRQNFEIPLSFSNVLSRIPKTLELWYFYCRAAPLLRCYPTVVTLNTRCTSEKEVCCNQKRHDGQRSLEVLPRNSPIATAKIKHRCRGSKTGA